jgi:4a-hydroxytetrahydrobiopterin dehydratase
MQPLPPEQVAELLKSTPEWNHDPAANTISTALEFSEAEQALDFVNAVAEIGLAANHNPDIYWYDVRFVQVMFTTKDAGGLTTVDFELAGQIDTLLQEAAAADGTAPVA